MPTPPAPVIRDVLLSTVLGESSTRSNSSLQQNSVLTKAAESLSIQTHGGSHDAELALLTQWQELFRTGLLAWGHNLSNPNPPFFHLTARGQRALANATRDPSNPSGYLRHLESRAQLGPVPMSYIREGLDCYVAGLFKAAGVMVGAAAEAVILELRDVAVQRLKSRGRPVPAALNKWQVKGVTDGLTSLFDTIDRVKDRELRGRYETYWSGFAGQIRNVRNEAGHPVTIEPVTADTVHASLLIFPELAGLARALSGWVVETD